MGAGFIAKVPRRLLAVWPGKCEHGCQTERDEIQVIKLPITQAPSAPPLHASPSPKPLPRSPPPRLPTPASIPVPLTRQLHQDVDPVPADPRCQLSLTQTGGVTPCTACRLNGRSQPRRLGVLSGCAAVRHVSHMGRAATGKEWRRCVSHGCSGFRGWDDSDVGVDKYENGGPLLTLRYMTRVPGGYPLVCV